MKIPFSKIFGLQHKPIPEKVKLLLKEKFPQAINVEWEIKDEIYEAVFYVNGVEHIAKISEENGLNEYKINMRPADLPSEITVECSKHGEVMNAIFIFKNSEEFFEVIVRNKDFERTLLLFNSQAKLIQSNKI